MCPNLVHSHKVMDVMLLLQLVWSRFFMRYSLVRYLIARHEVLLGILR